MLVSGGQILAIDKVNTGNTILGDGVQKPLNVNTDLIATTSSVSSVSSILNQNIDYVSGHLPAVSAGKNVGVVLSATPDSRPLYIVSADDVNIIGYDGVSAVFNDTTSSWNVGVSADYVSASDFEDYKEKVEQEFKNTSAWANETFQPIGEYISASEKFLSANALDDLSGKLESVYDTTVTASGNWNEASAFAANSAKFVTSAGVEFDPALAYFLNKSQENVTWSGVDLSDLGKMYNISSMTPEFISASISADKQNNLFYVISAAEQDNKIYNGSEYINVDNERDKISLKPKAITKVVGSDTVDIDESQNAQGNTEYTIHAKKLLQGSRYIEVDNENDTISLKPEGISKVENSDTTYVTTRTDENGNIAYKVNVNDDIVAPTYTGENPVVVNNTTKKISVNKLPMEIKEPLYAIVTPEKVSLGCNIENSYTFSHYYDGAIATASITTGDNNKIIDIWNYSDLSAGELISGTLIVEGFAYARQEYTTVYDDFTVILYFEDDQDVEHIIYKDVKKINAPDVDVGSIIIPFTLHYSESLLTAHTKVKLSITSSANVFLTTTANVYFNGFRKQAIV